MGYSLSLYIFTVNVSGVQSPWFTIYVSWNHWSFLQRGQPINADPVKFRFIFTLLNQSLLSWVCLRKLSQAVNLKRILIPLPDSCMLTQQKLEGNEITIDHYSTSFYKQKFKRNYRFSLKKWIRWFHYNPKKLFK